MAIKLRFKRSVLEAFQGPALFCRLTLLAFVIAYILGQIARFPGWPPVTALDLSVFFLIIPSLWSEMHKPQHPNRMKLFNYVALIGLFSWMLSLRLFSLQTALTGLMYFIRVAAYGWVVVNSKAIFDPVKKHVPSILLTFMALGLIQFIVIPDTRILLKYGWDEHYFRLIGTVLDPNYMGAIAGMIMLFVVTRKKNDKIMTLLGLSASMALALTYSRASWIATLVAIFTLAFYRSSFQIVQIKKATLFSIIFIATLFIAPKPGGEGVNLSRTSSITTRQNSWQKGIDVWRTHPLLGVGFNNYALATGKEVSWKVHEANAPDNSWLLLLDTLGIVGVGGLILIAWKFRTKLKKLSPVTVSLFVLIGIHALANNTLFFTPVIATFALLTVVANE